MRTLSAMSNTCTACSKPSFSCNKTHFADTALAVSVSFSALVRVIIARISIIILANVLIKNNLIARVEPVRA